MPPPGAGKGNWGSKPGVSEAAAEGAASAAQALSRGEVPGAHGAGTEGDGSAPEFESGEGKEEPCA